MKSRNLSPPEPGNDVSQGLTCVSFLLCGNHHHKICINDSKIIQIYFFKQELIIGASRFCIIMGQFARVEANKN